MSPKPKISGFFGRNIFGGIFGGNILAEIFGGNILAGTDQVWPGPNVKKLFTSVIYGFS